MPKELMELLLAYGAAVWRSLNLVDKLVMLGFTVFVVAMSIAAHLTRN